MSLKSVRDYLLVASRFSQAGQTQQGETFVTWNSILDSFSGLLSFHVEHSEQSHGHSERLLIRQNTT